jgi:inner membrane protein
LGACIGEAIAGKQLGKRAMLLGALAQSIPDIDFVSALWNDPASNLLAHRGFTHSLLFAVLSTALFALLAAHFHRRHKIGLKLWVLFFAVEIGVHLFLDAFNNYGMGLFEPFSHRRIAFNTIYVADPFFSLWPAIGFVALLLLHRQNRKRKFWWRFALVTSSLYLAYCVFNKIRIDAAVTHALAKQQIVYDKYLTTPTPLNNWLWYVAAGNKDGFFVGYRSVFDRKEEIKLHYFPKNDSLLNPVASHEEVQHLLRFAQGFYTVEKWGDTLVFNDLRFGQIIGWHDPKEKFAFHYFLQRSDAANKLVVQRGRFAKWNAETIRSLLKRIKGN